MEIQTLRTDIHMAGGEEGEGGMYGDRKIDSHI